MSGGDLYQEAQEGIQKALSKLNLASLEESIVSSRRVREVQALHVWGGNHLRQVVSLENVRGQVVNIQASEKSVGLITSDGELFVIGETHTGRDAAQGPTLLEYFVTHQIHVKQVAFGKNHVLAVGVQLASEYAHIYSWGANDLGQVGMGKAEPQYLQEPQEVPFFAKSSLRGVASI